MELHSPEWYQLFSLDFQKQNSAPGNAFLTHTAVFSSFCCIENLLGALLRIKEVIRQRVESSEEEDTDERGMTQRLEDILRESSGEKQTNITDM